jgi:hypothetical protein
LRAKRHNSDHPAVSDPQKNISLAGKLKCPEVPNQSGRKATDAPGLTLSLSLLAKCKRLTIRLQPLKLKSTGNAKKKPARVLYIIGVVFRDMAAIPAQ